MLKNPSSRVLLALQRAGWSPGRDVSSRVEEWTKTLCETGSFPRVEVAFEILRELGGLRVEPHTTGHDFAPGPVVFDPTLAVGEEDRFASHGEGLFPLGEVYDGHGFLAIEESGRTFIVGDELIVLGDTFEEGVSNLLEGHSYGR
ncbi:MAG: SUKH-3 domain-containing protein [Myxococcales bacterium]|nr:SUKH-3 domain-containing protein [Myxococcales bacterium]